MSDSRSYLPHEDGSYSPVAIEFGDRPTPIGWRRSAQALPLLLPPGAFLRRLRLTIRENANEAGAAEAVVHLEWAQPPAAHRGS